ncbi:Acetyltransferase (GNAT) domain-containing protein [Fictibacillus solisalsi]|uniref:Acetyltransferase (GNAT) domain-containing protein n=1 Tax=Fictibacillus solisalsi TaxID=459525 RepID=A0A1G9XIJ8_9BACL|nr:GNAT family N-acetyltransferase [Fictibacillus solisalsi]SDM96537.1 Acetyltransferase (GNAT) domain-containing protein [Fictibacillus solisalsi]
MEFTIRTVNDHQELENAIHLLGTVFPEEQTFFEGRLNKEPAYSFNTTWIAEKEGDMASVVQIFPFSIWVSGVEVKTAGIGNVATHPDYRGHRLTHRILEEVEQKLLERQYGLSNLFTGIPGFYEKAGWQTVNQPVPIIQAGHMKQEWDGAIPDGKLDIQAVTGNDLESILAIYEAFSTPLNGPRIRSEDYWKKQIENKNDNDIFQKAVRDNTVLSYIWAEKKNDVLTIHELCSLDDENDSMIPLVLSLLDTQIKTVRCLLPMNHFILKDVPYEIEENKEGMWKMIDQDEVLQQFQSVFEQRGRHLGMDHLQLSFLEDSWLFSWENGNTELKQSEFLHYLMRGADEIPARHSEIRELFPESSYIFWSKDRF